MFINFCIARPKHCFILCTPVVWQLWLNEYVTLCYVTQITVPCIYDLAAFGGGGSSCPHAAWRGGSPPTHVARSEVCVSVYVGNTNELCNNGRTDQDAF